MTNNNTFPFMGSVDIVMGELAATLRAINPDEAETFMEAVTGAGKVFCIGVGRVALSLSAMVKRFNHIGIESYMVGDLCEPAATPDDLLIVGSGSGETAVPVAIAKVAKNKGVKIAYIGANPDSSVGRLADLTVRISVSTKLNRPDEIPSRQIMSSLFEQSLLLFADCCALTLATRQNLDLKQLWRKHANLE